MNAPPPASAVLQTRRAVLRGIGAGAMGGMLAGMLGGYAALGAVIYAIYGFWHSKLAKGIDITEEHSMSSPAEAMGSGVDNQKD
jgi:hypothetical protein